MTLTTLILTVCLNAEMTQGCTVEHKPQPRQYTCAWEGIKETNKATKRGKFATADCQSQESSEVAKK